MCTHNICFCGEIKILPDTSSYMELWNENLDQTATMLAARTWTRLSLCKLTKILLFSHSKKHI